MQWEEGTKLLSSPFSGAGCAMEGKGGAVRDSLSNMEQTNGQRVQQLNTLQVGVMTTCKQWQAFSVISILLRL